MVKSPERNVLVLVLSFHIHQLGALRFYSLFLFFLSDIDTLCSFCDTEHESISHLFWECTYTSLFWKDSVSLFAFSSPSFSLSYKDVLLGLHNFGKDVKDQYFFINLFIFLAKFFFTQM